MDDTIGRDDSNKKHDAKMRSYGSVSVEDANVPSGGGLDDEALEEVESKPLLLFGKQIDTRSRLRALFTSIGVIFGAIILVSSVVVVGRQRAHSSFGLSPSALRSAIRPEALPLEGSTTICDARHPETCKEADCADPSKLNADCSTCMCGYDNNPNNPPFWCDGNAGCVVRLKEFQKTRYGKDFECENGMIADDDGWCVRKDMEFCDPAKLDTDPESCYNKCAYPQYVDRCKGCMCGYQLHIESWCDGMCGSKYDGEAWCDGNKGTPGDDNSGCTERITVRERPKYYDTIFEFCCHPRSPYGR